MVVNTGVQLWEKGKVSNQFTVLEGLLGPANASLSCFSVNEQVVSMDTVF